MLNFFCWKNHFLGHVEFFLLKEPHFGLCWIFSPERSPFFQKSASFCWNVEYVESCWMYLAENMLLSAEMLNMLNMLKYFASSWCQTGPTRAKTIQHIQHIQHFSRKEHIFRTWDPTWFNIFNISAERSTFWLECSSGDRGRLKLSISDYKKGPELQKLSLFCKKLPSSAERAWFFLNC